MKDKRGKKLMIACVCIFLSAIFLTTSLIQKKKLSEETKNQKEQKTQESEKETDPELYQESGDPIVVYFTNTAQIDEKGALPYKEIERLTEETQNFLKSKSNKNMELRVEDGSLEKVGNVTGFTCKVGEKYLEIKYDESSDVFNFSLRRGASEGK